MTLILSLCNKEHAVQISDRRLSCNGRLVDDESNKCGVIFCLDARMAFGYTGLAKWKGFITSVWLLKALHDSATPDFTIGKTLERLKVNATEEFKHNPELKKISPEHKRLAVMFSGFLNLGGETKAGNAIMSNYHNFKNNTSYNNALDEFSINYRSTTKEELNPTLVQRIGSWHGMTNNDIIALRKLLLLGKPPQAIIGKALEIVRDIADRPLSQGTIGKQLTSIVIPRNPKEGVQSNYSSNSIKAEAYVPALVCLLPNMYMNVDNIKISPVDKDTPPISVPKVNKNAPCPCGSKKRYKDCHGKKTG